MDDRASNRRSDAEIFTIEGPSMDPRARDSMSTRWTDEKHSLFLDSIEASFVDQLYSSKCYSKNLFGWFLRWRKRTHSSGLYENDLTSGQFKVLHRGCWENARNETSKTQANIKNDSLTLFAYPWIQHFRSPSIGKEKHSISVDMIGDNDFVKPLIQDASQRNEVTDQNFVDDELEAAEGSSRTCKKRRLMNPSCSVPLVNDHVVPSEKSFLTPISDENHAHPDERNAECSSKTSRDSASNLHADAESSLLKDKD